MKRTIKNILLSALILLLIGCSEADFVLSSDSRLPKWFTIPKGESRENYTVDLSYYVWPSGREATLKLTKKGDLLAKEKVTVKLRGLEPIILENSPRVYYPSYEVVTGNGITDIIEHRKAEPIFYMADDPKVWAELIKSEG